MLKSVDSPATEASGSEALGESDAPRKRGSKGVGLFAIALLIGLGGWVSVRVQSTLASQDEMAKAREATAAAAKRSPTGAKRVEIVTPTVETWTPSIRFEGSLMPARDGELGFKIGGRLESIRARMGDFVKQGSVLATLEAREADAQRRAAEAGTRAADVQLAMANDNAGRMAKVVEQGAMSDASGVQAKSSFELARAQADVARAQLDLATTSFGNHTLAAPFSGFIMRAPSAPGAIVGPGVPLFRLLDVSVIRLVGTVAEADGAFLKVGSKVELEIDGKVHEGRVVGLVPALDQVTRRIPVEAELSNPDLAIRSGALVVARIVGAKPIEVLRLPASALRPGSQGEVMVVDGAKLASRRVIFANVPSGEILVRSGLGRDERVLLSPPAEAKDGDALPTGASE